MSLLAVACGGAAMPSEKLTNSRASIRAAEEAGAQQTPQAALHLKLARDQVARAERLIRNGQNEDATLALDQAQADADLALALSHETQAKRDAEQAKARIAELREQSQVQ
ncbi:MAG TPA: DUF4398 domain-containing protein [Polyangiaceae bacterium]|jgi:hypothetical protein|nr:DUF4398 domain-containing protein [Polyangiaceae bacterium]